MSDIAIHVEGLGKRYQIGQLQKYKALRDVLAGMVTAPVRAATSLLGSGSGKQAEELFWALKDVSFDIRYGEVVGIIGRNGAGKSTLLKILSRIVEPTEGYARIRGRVGSLLEVGTGFHPELTGRENVYLNGAIIGMRKFEIKRKFDEIVAFAEMEKFIDTPVKHYSSGMYVRLAFAVAAHLEPEILLVDEVLAVGDAAFQEKCLGKMTDVARDGRTVLFVSHNMSAVRQICYRGILLSDSKVAMDGDVSKAVSTYLSMLEQSSTQDLAERRDRRGGGLARFKKVTVTNYSQSPRPNLTVGEPVQFVFDYEGTVPGLSCVFTIYTQTGQRIATFDSTNTSPQDIRVTEQEGRYVCLIDEMLLTPGRYRVNAALKANNDDMDYVEAALVFDVHEGLLAGRRVRANNFGNVALHHSWRLPGI